MSQVNKLRDFIYEHFGFLKSDYLIDDNWTFEELCELKMLVDDTIREKLEIRK
jgi:hypothetical protein